MAKRRLATVKLQKLKRWNSSTWPKDGSTAISAKTGDKNIVQYPTKKLQPTICQSREKIACLKEEKTEGSNQIGKK
jgi:hypothetical protein